MWCVLQQSHFFNEYRLVGAPEDENEIYLELSPGKSLTLFKVLLKINKIFFLRVVNYFGFGGWVNETTHLF